MAPPAELQRLFEDSALGAALREQLGALPASWFEKTGASAANRAAWAQRSKARAAIAACGFDAKRALAVLTHLAAQGVRERWHLLRAVARDKQHLAGRHVLVLSHQHCRVRARLLRAPCLTLLLAACLEATGLRAVTACMAACRRTRRLTGCRAKGWTTGWSPKGCQCCVGRRWAGGGGHTLVNAPLGPWEAAKMSHWEYVSVDVSVVHCTIVTSKLNLQGLDTRGVSRYK